MASKKIVLLSDSPTSTTGLGRLSRNFLKMFPEHEWYIWGINHQKFYLNGKKLKPIYDIKEFEAKFEITSPRVFGGTDPYHLPFLVEYMKQVKPDYFISCIDPDRLSSIKDELKKLQMTQPFTWVNYFPMDRSDYNPLEVIHFHLADHNVGYAQYAADELKRLDPSLNPIRIYLPVDIEEYPKLNRKEKKAFRKDYFGKESAKKFIFGTINRNFFRKDPARLIMAYKKYKENNDNSLLYMHSSMVSFENCNLSQLIFHLGLGPDDIVFPAKDFDEISGITQEGLNKILNTFDVFVTASMGEGYGYSTVEAMMAEIPVVAPNNTTFPEFIKDYGYLVEATEPVFFYKDSQTFWYVANTQKFAETMQKAKEDKEAGINKSKGSRKWVEDNLSLDVIKKQWQEIIK